MPTGTKIRDRTHTRVTRDRDTAVIPVPVMNPMATAWLGLSHGLEYKNMNKIIIK